MSTAAAPATEALEKLEGRTSRTRVALKGGFALGAHRGLSFAVGLLMIPLAAHTLPRAEFGPWLLLSTIPALLGFLDLGLANGLVTLVATESARGSEGRANIHRYVSSASFLLAVVGAMIAVGFGLVASILDLRGVMGATEALPEGTFASGLLVVGLAAAVMIPLSVGQRLAQGLQQMHLVGVTGIAGAGFQLAAACACAVLGAGFTWFVFVSSSAALVSAAIAWIVVFYRVAPDLRPTRHLVDRASARLVLQRGGLFLVLGIAGAIAFQTDALVIASRLGVENVPAYAATYRLFAIAPAVITLFALPLWAAHADAFARGEHQWTRRMLRRSTAGAAAFTVLATAIVLVIARPVLSWTLGDADPNPSLSLLLAIGATAIVLGVSPPLAMVMNAANVVLIQVVFATLMCIANLVLSLILVEAIGIEGPALATAITQTVFCILPGVLYIRVMLRRKEAASAESPV